LTDTSYLPRLERKVEVVVDIEDKLAVDRLVLVHTLL